MNGADLVDSPRLTRLNGVQYKGIPRYPMVQQDQPSLDQVYQSIDLLILQLGTFQISEAKLGVGNFFFGAIFTQFISTKLGK